jgi:nicotinate-nucleotide adenylyltransferase
MGGTFDPVHYGHLRSALELKQRIGFEQLRLIPCHIPPHRQQPHCGSEHRWQMLQCALQEFPQLSLDNRELERDSVSYSVETLESLRQELGEDCSLSLVLGNDAFAGLASWHRWQELSGLAHIVVMARPGYQLPNSGSVAELLAARQTSQHEQLLSSAAGRILSRQVLMENR